jgi:hypothetical protein
LLKAQTEVKAKGYELVDMRGTPYEPVQALTFVRNPETGRLG